MNNDDLISNAVEIIINGSNARPPENLVIPDGKLNIRSLEHVDLENKVAEWFQNYLRFQRVIPKSSTEVEIVNGDEYYLKNRKSLSFGINDGKTIRLQAVEASFLQLSASTVVTENGRHSNCEEMLNRVLKNSNVQKLLASFYLYRRNYQVYFDPKQFNYSYSKLPKFISIDFKRIIKQNLKPSSSRRPQLPSITTHSGPNKTKVYYDKIKSDEFQTDSTSCEYLKELQTRYPTNIKFEAASRFWSELKRKEEEEIKVLRAEFDIGSIPSISLQKIESKTFEMKSPSAEKSQCMNDNFMKMRMRPPKNQFRKVENKLEVEYDLITVDPRNQLPSLNTLSEDYRRNTVFGVVEERTMLLFHMEKFNPSRMQNISK